MLEHSADDPDMENRMVDRTIARAHASAVGATKNDGQSKQALGRSRGGFSTQIHVTVDGLGNPLCLHLTAGQRHDSIKVYDLTVDLAFDYLKRRSQLRRAGFCGRSGIEVAIPPNRNAKAPREYDAWRNRKRHLLEYFIGEIKHLRRVFSRFDKLARRYPGFL